MAVTYLSTWIPVTTEMAEDAQVFGPWLHANLEYELLETKPPLFLDERVTGWRYWMASNGVQIRVRVGWRAELHEIVQRFAYAAWPEDYVEDDD